MENFDGDGMGAMKFEVRIFLGCLQKPQIAINENLIITEN